MSFRSTNTHSRPPDLTPFIPPPSHMLIRLDYAISPKTLKPTSNEPPTFRDTNRLDTIHRTIAEQSPLTTVKSIVSLVQQNPNSESALPKDLLRPSLISPSPQKCPPKSSPPPTPPSSLPMKASRSPYEPLSSSSETIREPARAISELPQRERVELREHHADELFVRL